MENKSLPEASVPTPVTSLLTTVTSLPTPVTTPYYRSIEPMRREIRTVTGAGYDDSCSTLQAALDARGGISI